MSRNLSRKKKKPPAAKPRPRTSHFWRWTPAVLLLFVAGLAVAFQGINSETNKKAPAIRSEQPTKAKPSLTPKTEALAYGGGQNDWQPKLLKELKKGQEFQLDNHLCYVDHNGLIRMNPGVDIALLSEADRYFDEENNSRYPEAKDVVRFVDQDRNHLRHDRMIMAKAGDLFYFQGCLFETSSAAKGTNFISIRKTGTVLRPPYYPRSYDDEEIDAKTWRFIQLEKREADGGLTKVDLLRPIWWLDEYQASEGGFIYLDLVEMGASGRFRVKSIGPCPEIEPGPAGTQPVIGKFSHENAVVLDLYFEGESKPLSVTANHPIWSETHQKYLPAGELRIGDEVKNLTGTSKLLRVKQRPGLHTVYNLEVHKEHVYRVGESGILVHNKQIATSCGSGFGSRIPYEDLSAQIRRIHSTLPESGSYAILSKKDVSMRQLRALTRHTGDEYSMFTRGNQRLIIRGKGGRINVSKAMYSDILAGKYGRYSGHTHPPGHSVNPGPGDQLFLRGMNQKQSGIWGDDGVNLFDRGFPYNIDD